MVELSWTEAVAWLWKNSIHQGHNRPACYTMIIILSIDIRLLIIVGTESPINIARERLIIFVIGLIEKIIRVTNVFVSAVSE